MVDDPGPLDSHCARCLRPAPSPDDDEFIYWEAFGDEGKLSLCPDCITPEEQQAMDEVIMDLMDQADPDTDDRWSNRPCPGAAASTRAHILPTICPQLHISTVNYRRVFQHFNPAVVR
jgi:hypothetical protein